MPHIVINMYPGRNDEIKTNLANAVAETVADQLKMEVGKISVEIEEVNKEDWKEYFKTNIENNDKVYHKPDYNYD